MYIKFKVRFAVCRGRNSVGTSSEISRDFVLEDTLVIAILPVTEKQ